MKLLFLTKPTSWGNIAKKYVEENFTDFSIVIGDWGDPLPESLHDWKGDYIISFLSPWIFPQEILDKAKIAAINFHPAPPNYPGIGCYNFAIYNDEEEYGVLCHHMVKKVDSGSIISVKRFPIDIEESVLTLKKKSMNFLFELFQEIMNIILKGKKLNISDDNWKRDAYTRKDFQELCKLDINMSEEELNRRLRATYFPGALDYPNVKIGGKKYILIDPKEFEELRKKLK